MQYSLLLSAVIQEVSLLTIVTSVWEQPYSQFFSSTLYRLGKVVTIEHVRAFFLKFCRLC